jgi:hypothetical protein
VLYCRKFAARLNRKLLRRVKIARSYQNFLCLKFLLGQTMPEGETRKSFRLFVPVGVIATHLCGVLSVHSKRAKTFSRKPCSGCDRQVRAIQGGLRLHLGVRGKGGSTFPKAVTNGPPKAQISGGSAATPCANALKTTRST